MDKMGKIIPRKEKKKLFLGKKKKPCPTSIPVIVPWTCVPFFNAMVTVS
jgi:hypothetical protein